MTTTKQYLLFLAIFRGARSIAAGMISIAFPYLVLVALHDSAFVLGLLYVCGAISTAVLGVVFGFLADTWGQKRTLFLVGSLLPLSSSLVYCSSHLGILFVASAFGGYSATGSLMGGGVGGAAQPIQIVALAQLTEMRNRTSMLALFSFMSGALAALGALAVRLLSVHDAFLAAAILSFGGVLCLIPMRLQEYRGDIRRLSSRNVIGKFTLTGALNGLAAGLIVPFLVPFFVLVYHLPKSEMSVYGFMAGLLGSFALLAAPRLEDFCGFVRSIALTRGVGATLLILLPLTHIFALAMAIYLITPSLRVMAMPVQQTALTGFVSRDEVGRALGINQVARLGSSSAAIGFTGYMFSLSEVGLPFYAYAAVMGVNIYLYYRFFRPLEA